MISQTIPGFGDVAIERVLLDYNGTLALDGELLDGVAEAVRELALHARVSVLTADTHGTVNAVLDGLCPVSILPPGDERRAKLEALVASNPESTAFIGNGANDELALREAAVSICVIGSEGAASTAMAAADVVCTDILSAFGLLLHPARLRATLRR